MVVHGLNLEISLASVLLNSSLSEWRDNKRWHLYRLLNTQINILLNSHAVFFQLFYLPLDLRKGDSNQFVLSLLGFDLLLLVRSLLLEVVDVRVDTIGLVGVLVLEIEKA